MKLLKCSILYTLIAFFSIPVSGQLVIGNLFIHKNVAVRNGAYGYLTFVEDAVFLKYDLPKAKNKKYAFSIKTEASLENYRHVRANNLVKISRFPLLIQLNAKGLNSETFSFTMEGGYVFSLISSGQEFATKGVSHGYIAGFGFNFYLENELTAIFGYRRLLDLKSTINNPVLFGESNFYIGLQTDIVDLFRDLFKGKKKKY